VYSGGEVDGAENGPAPLPWDIDAQPSLMFKNEEQFIRVPHTSSVRQCHRCKGAGHIECTKCYGKGWVCIMINFELACINTHLKEISFGYLLSVTA
jgi:hypothetical protein